MTTVSHGTLVPTGEPVTYTNSFVDYPPHNVVDTFSTVLLSKVYGKDLNYLEVASSGKIAFTTSDSHSLDLLSESGATKFQARDSNDLILMNETETAAITAGNSGDLTLLAADGDSVFNLTTANGIDMATSTGDATFAVSESNAFRQAIGGRDVFIADTSGVTVSNLTVESNEFRVPVGDLAFRPEGVAGQIYYNNETLRFEGFSSGNWQGLGGVVDVDQNTKILAELQPGSDENTLFFYTAGELTMVLDDQGRLGIGTSNPEHRLDVDGNLKAKHAMVDTISIGDGKTIPLALGTDGTKDVIDGESNDGAGVVVAGVPKAEHLSFKERSRFEKSLKWRHGTEGMSGLGQKDNWANESYWELKGGAFHLNHTNTSTGDDMSYIWRVNEKDELQLVRKHKTAKGTKYDVVFKFGNEIGGDRLTQKSVSVSVHQTVSGQGQLETTIRSYSAFGSYRYYCALYPVDATPTVSEIVSASVSNGFQSDTLSENVPIRIVNTFTTMSDGTAIPDAILKVMFAVEFNGTLQGDPSFSFALPGEAPFREALEDVTMQTEIETEIVFDQLEWDTLDEADKEAFKTWFRQQLVEYANVQGIEITYLDVVYSSGSVKAAIKHRVQSTETDSSIAWFTETDRRSLFGQKSKVPLAVPVEIDPARVIKSVKTAKLVAENPVVNQIETNSFNIQFKVSDSISNTARIHLVSSPVPIRNITSSDVVNSADAIVHEVSGAGSEEGEFAYSFDSESPRYVYAVVESVNGTLSRVVSRKFDPIRIIVPETIPKSAASGLYKLVDISLEEGNWSLSLREGIKMYSDAPELTSFLAFFPVGSPDIPTTAAEFFAGVDSGLITSFAEEPVV